MDVERRLLWVGSSIALLSLIFAVFSVSDVNLRHVGVMLVFFGVAVVSLYGAFRVYKESKIKWSLFGLGFIVSSVAVSQLTMKFDDPVSVIVAGLISLLTISLIETTKILNQKRFEVWGEGQ
ncbi:hypothetical protein PNA2_1930 [Pyrococcus sp. NA2]|uniref:hypothetical protein n=1 Tax=Pyrococcus sp. (strain NA2) TaxID=342949 RepID=UPI000209AD96|nr:hypothetical protein [Pyrococcus sp. NA2]AEC52844.1 hypothetical protein PNA2_1930 [Pyrococcus sp. NA2]